MEIIASNIALSIEMQRNYEFLFKKGERARDFTHSLRNKIKTAILNTKDAKSKLHKEDISSVSRCLEIIDSTLSEIKEYQKSALTDDEGTKLNLPISELIIELRKLIENEKRISFKISQTDEERYLHVNKAQILEGLENIIGNAIDSFSHEEKARLWIDIHIVENSPVEQAVITITDNGKGLTGEQKKEFKKNKTITSTKRFSLGTGIARANRCFADNSGHFEYQDPSPDKTDRGTSFVITLPAYKPQDLRILIVDDEKGTLETFKRKVGEIKNLIADYSSSLKIFQQDMGRKDSGFKSYINTFDWILLDCHFKDSSKDGTNIFKEYAELNKKISNKIILMSGEESYLMRGDIKILDKYEDILNDFSKFISSLNKAEGVDK
ncbi:MAG: HAMP domain-containing histidine kinase [Desulfobacteraceae bacterium]|nr:HAMP domain-containing histidine kinase [Desulfobacteraceae bacterium]MBC2756279.1 HAMP domain-containing histidine kinase [Desulfobacteraceae bacterium]